MIRGIKYEYYTYYDHSSNVLFHYLFCLSKCEIVYMVIFPFFMTDGSNELGTNFFEDPCALVKLVPWDLKQKCETLPT